MIVNQTAMTKQDIDFLNALLRKRPFLIILRILAFLLGTVWFLSGSAGLFFLIRDRDGKPSFWIYALLLFALGLLLLLLQLSFAVLRRLLGSMQRRAKLLYLLL